MRLRFLAAICFCACTGVEEAATETASSGPGAGGQGGTGVEHDAGGLDGSASGGGGSAGHGGAGGAKLCGNGTVDTGEVCDAKTPGCPYDCKCSFTYNGHCYIVTSTTSWVAAYTTCVNLGMDLAALTTLSELNYVSGAIDILNKDSEAYYAIGATDQLTEGVWKWTTGEPWTAENEQMWHSQEPDGGTAENCGWLSSTGWLFHSDACGDGAPTLCESTEPMN